MKNILNLTLSQKAVSVVVAISKPNITKILNLLTPSEVKILLERSKEIQKISQENINLILEEFENEFTNGIGLFDPFGEMKNVVPEGINIDDLLNSQNQDFAPVVEARSAWDVVMEAEPLRVAAYLSAENPQVAAYVLSRLPTSKASEIITHLDRPEGLSIITRIMEAAEVSRESQTFIETVLLAEFGKNAESQSESGVKKIAAIINELDSSTADKYLEELPDFISAESLAMIKSSLFRFEDIRLLESSQRALIFDAVPVDMLTLALRDAVPEMIEATLSSIGQRSRRMIENELRSKVQVRPVDVAGARKKIVNEVMRLVGQGRIDITTPDVEAA